MASGYSTTLAVLFEAMAKGSTLRDTGTALQVRLNSRDCLFSCSMLSVYLFLTVVFSAHNCASRDKTVWLEGIGAFCVYFGRRSQFTFTIYLFSVYV